MTETSSDKDERLLSVQNGCYCDDFPPHSGLPMYQEINKAGEIL